MLTMAEILEMGTNNNLCKVRIPILEPAGNKTQVTIWATMTLPPGIHGGYEVGDVVFVSFADNTLNRPVVLGQLYKGVGRSGNVMDKIGSTADKFDKASEISCKNFEATGTVQIPTSTKLTYPPNKNAFYATLQELVNDVADIKTRLVKLEELVGSPYDETSKDATGLFAEVDKIDDVVEKINLLKI